MVILWVTIWLKGITTVGDIGVGIIPVIIIVRVGEVAIMSSIGLELIGHACNHGR